MPEPSDDAQIESLAARACADAGLDPIYARVVRDYVKDRSDLWRECCGSSCDPCMFQIADVVDRVRNELATEDSDFS